MDKEYFIVSIDFDGVLAQGLKVKLKYAKEWFGVDLRLDQTKKEGFDALMKQLSKKVNYRNLMDPLNEQHIMEYETPSDCLNVLHRLFAQNCRFVVITSRNDHDYPYAVHYIEEKFDGLIKNIHNTRNEPKEKFISRLKPRAHIDDDLSKLEELQDCPVELVYYRQPENASIEIPAALKNRIWEASNFNEIEAIIMMIKELHQQICENENIINNWTNIARIYSKMRKVAPAQTRKLLDAT